MFNLHKIFAIVHKNGLVSFALLAILSTILSTIGFINESSSFNIVMVLQAIGQSIDDLPNYENLFLILGKLCWMITFASAAFSLFLKDWSHKQFLESVKDENHIVILGLGELSYSYISTLNKETTIILNNNTNISSEQYKVNGYAIKDINLKDIESDLNISHIEKIVINTSNDRDNINIAFKIIDLYAIQNCTNAMRIIVRTEDRELNALFTSNSVFSSKDFNDSKIELKTYSFFEEASIKLFQDNFIDGDNNDILESYDDYSIVISGDGNLANKIVYEAAKIAHLPNQNILNIYLLCDNPKKFKKSLIMNYPNIEKIPTLKLHEKQIDHNDIEYYNDSIWGIINLTNVIVCYDDENVNLKIASALQDKTYLRKIDAKTNVLFGVFNQGNISKKLDSDDINFNIFKSFGNSKDILSKENIFDDETHLIAKCINYTYTLLNENHNDAYDSNAIFNYKLNHQKIDEQWFKTKHTDKISSLAQSKHIKIKLKTLGLQAIKSSKNTKKLLKINRGVVDCLFDFEFKGNYNYPINYEDTLFDKMIRLEHNRWNAFHYLNGWEYSSNKDKSIKKHDCLMPLSNFSKYFSDEQRLMELIEWDIYAFMYIPNYLAEANYEIRIK